MIFCLFLVSTELHIVNTGLNESGEYKEVPILMYHSIRDKKMCSRYVVKPNFFEEDLKYIKDNGYTTIFMEDLINYVFKNKELPEKPIMITFDDGFYDNYKYAFPLLKKYNSKMVLSPIGIEADKYSKDFSDPEPYDHVYCSWKILKEMNDSKLVEIQNHSYDMHRIGKRYGIKKKKGENLEEYEEKLTNDFKKAQDKIKENIGVTPTAFIFPLGALDSYSKNILKDNGFKVLVTCYEKVNKIVKGNKECLYNLGRFIRTSRYPSEKFFKKRIEKKSEI